MSEDYKRILESSLWNIANTLRGSMNADEFKSYILGFIFYKFLSEKLLLFANEILTEDGIKYTDIPEDTEEGRELLEAAKDSCLDKLGYFLKPSELFSEMVKRGKDHLSKSNSSFILEDLEKVLTHIQDSTVGTASERDFSSLFDDMDLTSNKLGTTPEARNTIIVKIISELDRIDFRLQDTEADVLGDAYEYLIAQFAAGAGRTAGEFYTPQQVSKILAKIVTTGKTKLRSVYDPTCGSGSLLLRVAREVEEVSDFYGQEKNSTTYNLARMNMILHGVHYNSFDIRLGDTLENPHHIEQKFDAVVANPPFSIQWSADPQFLTDDRFSQAGRLPPASKADYAFVQHMLYQLDENGVMAVVLPHGALFRGAAEGHIRRFLIENKNWLDAVIGLPANIFYGAAIPTSIVVFKKCREHPDNILFIDASKYFEKIKTQNILRDEDVARIIDTYRKRETIEAFSYVASLDDIRANEYNLNIPRYVDSGVEEEIVDISAVAAEIVTLEKELISTDETISQFCNELSIPRP